MFVYRYPWGQEAFKKAKEQNKPIFLSVGYSTCHWCHVMERESFESVEIGQLLNQSFVSIKVDREERPDVDKVYMTFIQVWGPGEGVPGYWHFLVINSFTLRCITLLIRMTSLIRELKES